MEIQEQMCERAIELLALPDDEPRFILDIGCGSGLSGSVLEDQGHVWIGMDIAQAMLDVAVDRDLEGDLVLSDMGQGVPFRAGTFDGAISISAIQWLCFASKKEHIPQKRLYRFFTTLYASLSRSARAVFQFYPENNHQLELIRDQAMKAGFYGGVVIDFPNSSRAKKHYLVLMTGGSAPLPKPLGDEEAESNQIAFIKGKREFARRARGKGLKKTRDWIMDKKEKRRQLGEDVRRDSKYTGRKRSGRF